MFLYRQSFCLWSPLSEVPTVALKLKTVLVFTLVLSFAFVLAFLALGVFTFLAFGLLTIGTSLIVVEWPGCHDRLATE